MLSTRKREANAWLVVFILTLIGRPSNQIQLPLDAQQQENYALERNFESNKGGEGAEDWREIFAENYKDLIDSNGMEPYGEDAMESEEDVFSGKLNVIEHWPVREITYGQISGLATDPDGYLYVFHRADRKWTDNMFDKDNVFTKKQDGPIKEATLYAVNGTNGIVLNKLFEQFFYLPHGLSIDSAGNRWMTDVAMHQVFKFEVGKKTPSLILGKAFEPAKSNDDTERFCQPTDVAVASNGDIFVSDGYCASRVMKFDKNGKFLQQFGLEDSQIPHSIELLEDLDLICVADREGMRVLCYNAGISEASKLGEPEREYTDESMGRVFSIAYSQTDGVLYGVTGPTGTLTSQGFTIDMRDDSHYRTDIIALWSPEDRGFGSPHAVAVSPDGESVFVGEINEKNSLWKFVKEQ